VLGFAVATGLLGCGGSDHPRPDSTTGAATGTGASAGLGANAGSGNGVSVGGAQSNGGAANGGTAGVVAGSSAGGALGTGSSMGTGGSTLPTGVEPSALIPQRIRRLSNDEFDASVKALTGSSKALAQKFAPDQRQSGFTVNDAQRIDNVTAKQIFAAAQELAAELKANVNTRAPCTTTGGSDACAKTFIQSFGQRAYRRPLSTEEAGALFAVYQTAQTGGTYADGIELVATAVLNSAGFLYLTELGSGPPATANAAVALTPYELANTLSYMLTAAPASDQLVADALAGKLDTPEGRAKAFQDLLGGPTRDHIARVVAIVREWVGVDRLEQTDKDSTVYKDFKDLKAAMEAESNDFIASLLKTSASPGGTVHQLLFNASTVAGADLAAFYAEGTTEISKQPARQGILNQAAFLSVFAHASESAPVLRGVEVARRIACIDVPSPTTLDIQVVPPPPDKDKSTRARFEAHVSDPVCVSCHFKIDPFGFAFEEYDGMGRFRTLDQKQPVDTKVTVAMGSDFDGPLNNSNELAAKLSMSEQVRSCFARHMFRASAARSDSTVAASEEAFMKYWAASPAANQGDILETLATFVTSPLFTHRRGE
jgi:hypothetical protein